MTKERFNYEKINNLVRHVLYSGIKPIELVVLIQMLKDSYNVGVIHKEIYEKDIISSDEFKNKKEEIDKLLKLIEKLK